MEDMDIMDLAIDSDYLLMDIANDELGGFGAY
jgi:hypothetical protein